MEDKGAQGLFIRTRGSLGDEAGGRRAGPPLRHDNGPCLSFPATSSHSCCCSNGHRLHDPLATQAAALISPPLAIPDLGPTVLYPTAHWEAPPPRLEGNQLMEVWYTSMRSSFLCSDLQTQFQAVVEPQLDTPVSRVINPSLGRLRSAPGVSESGRVFRVLTRRAL